MSRRYNLVLLFVLIMGSVVPLVSGLGVTPARTTLDFSPGLQQTVTFSVLNSEQKDLNLFVFARGELNESIALSEESVILNSGEGGRELSYSITLPQELTPGLHTAEIVVLDLPSGSKDGEAHVGTVIGVATQLYVHVPFPGKYLDASLNIMGAEDRKDFVIPLVSRGLEDISTAHARIVIVDSSGDIVAELTTQEVSLTSGTRTELTAQWDVDVPTGNYLARAVLSYDGEEVLLEQEFEIGELLLDLKQIFVEDFQLGEIAQFNMIVENKWGEQISDVYAEMRVFDDAFSEVASIRSATYTIPSGAQTTIEYFWDTTGIATGTYNAQAILYYVGKQIQQDFKLAVAQDRIDVIGLGYVISEADAPSRGGNNLVIILSTVIGVLVIMNLLWFLVLRKKLHPPRKNRK